MLNNSWNMSSSRRVNEYEPIEENKMMILMAPIAADPEENLGALIWAVHTVSMWAIYSGPCLGWVSGIGLPWWETNLYP
jgi:hypothetical protein